MKFSNKLTIWRISLFTVTLVSVLFSMTLDMFIKGDSLLYYLTFWTHLSNMSVLVWSVLGLMSVIKKNENFEKKINSFWTKGLVTTTIFVTGTVFVIAAYFPILFKYLNPNLDYATQVYPELHLFNHDRGQMIFIENNIHTYAFMIVFGTTLLHVVVPTMMTSEFFITKGLSTKENDGKIKDRISLALIIPGMYFTYVLFLTSAIGVRAPYPVFNFNPFAFETTQPPAYFQWISLIADLAVMIWYVLVFTSFSLITVNNGSLKGITKVMIKK